MNFGIEKTRLADWLAVSGQTNRLSASVLGDLVNLSQKTLIRTTRLEFGEATAAETLPANASAIQFDRLLYPFALWSYIGSDAPTQVKQRTYREFRAQYPLQSTGSPASGDAAAVYTLFGGNVLVAPVPTVQCTLQVDGYFLPTDFVDDADTSNLLETAWDTVLWGAMVKANQYIFRDDKAASWMASYEASRRELQRLHGIRESEDRVSEIRQPA